MNEFDANEVEKDKFIKGGNCGHATMKSQANGSVTGKWNNIKENRESSAVSNQRERKTRQVKATVDNIAEQQKQQDEYYQRYRHGLLVIYVLR